MGKHDHERESASSGGGGVKSSWPKWQSSKETGSWGKGIWRPGQGWVRGALGSNDWGILEASVYISRLISTIASHLS